MEIPLVPLLVGGVVIMTIISWAEDRLKDENKETVKHWKKDSPLRQAFKTVAELKFSKDISNETNNDALRNFHKEIKGVAKTVLKGKFNKSVASGMDGNFEKFKKDIVGAKNEKEFMNTVDTYAKKMGEYIPPDKSTTFIKGVEGHFKLGKGNPEGILKKDTIYKPNEDILSLDGGRSKRRTKKKNTKKKSRKRSKRRTTTRRR